MLAILINCCGLVTHQLLRSLDIGNPLVAWVTLSSARVRHIPSVRNEVRRSWHTEASDVTGAVYTGIVVGAASTATHETLAPV